MTAFYPNPSLRAASVINSVFEISEAVLPLQSVCDLYSQLLIIRQSMMRPPIMALQYIEATVHYLTLAFGGNILSFTGPDGNDMVAFHILVSRAAMQFARDLFLKVFFNDQATQSASIVQRTKNCLTELVATLVDKGAVYTQWALLLRTALVAHDMLVQGAVTKDQLCLLKGHSRDYLACFPDDCDHAAYLPLMHWTQWIKDTLMIDPRTQRLASQVTGTEIMQEAHDGGAGCVGHAGAAL